MVTRMPSYSERVVFVNKGLWLGWQGEDQKKLDVISNEVFCNALRASGRTGVIASEEEDLPVAVEETYSGACACKKPGSCSSKNEARIKLYFVYSSATAQ